MKRRLQSLVWSAGLALLALALLRAWAEAASGQARPGAPAVTFTVTSFLDAPDDDLTDGICHNATDNKCSLRAAVQQMDHDSGGLINLPAGTYTLTNDTAGDLQLRKNTNLSGAGSTATIIRGNPAGWSHRILRVQDGALVTIVGVTIEGGHIPSVGGGIYLVTGTLVLSGSAVLSNTAGTYGGGIYNTGQLSILNSTIRSNQAISDGGGIDDNAADLAISPAAALMIVNSVVSDNTAGQSGGGLQYSDVPLAPRTSLHFDNSTFSGNRAQHLVGGGVHSIGGVMFVNFDTFSANTALVGGGIDSDSGQVYVQGSHFTGNTATSNGGGGIEVVDSGSRLVLQTSEVAGNLAPIGDGAGLATRNSVVDVQDSRIVDNVSGGVGGGIFSDGDVEVISQTTISRNQSGKDGGGILNEGSALTITGSTISDNAAGGNEGVGGGIDNFFSPQSTARLALVNSTIDRNYAAGNGGGVANSAGIVDLSNATVADNVADSNGNGSGDGGGLYNPDPSATRLRNSIVARNLDLGGQAPDCFGNLASQGYNLVQTKAGCAIASPTDLYGLDPRLDLLQGNGGATATRALIVHSPAIDAGNPNGCQDGSGQLLTVDQRGFPRPVGPRCDIGAFEGSRLWDLFLPLVRR